MMLRLKGTWSTVLVYCAKCGEVSEGPACAADSVGGDGRSSAAKKHLMTSA
jgi:hypothetical protein